MHNLASLLDQISTCSISKVREMRRIMKGVLSLVLPEDPDRAPVLDPVSVLVRVHVEGADRHRHLRIGDVDSDGNYGYRVVADFVFGDENQWPEVRRLSFELEHMTNKYVSLFGSLERYYELIQRTQWVDGHAPPEHWSITPGSLYIIANAFNLCVVLIARLGSTTLLPLYLYSDRTAGTLPLSLQKS
ncbi:hypothetical protein M9H77_14295 [Catharanthus roseus]|uniref:Uncharacterized protein n=1 Tax=Catharanthus roseus TaxID=4058 RepID=A0ACC0BMX2_CATRO|nr:hypothetical protein M9H77_14295 [Catharanthus roseus]